MTGEIAKDPQFRFDGDVADRPGAHPPAAFSAVQLQLVELHDRWPQRLWDGVQHVLSAVSGATLGIVVRKRQPVPAEEGGQRPRQWPIGTVVFIAVRQELPRRASRVGIEQPAELAQQVHRTSGIVRGRDERGEPVPPVRSDVQPFAERGAVTEWPVWVGQLTAVAQPVPGVAAELSAAHAGDELGRSARRVGSSTARADPRRT